MSASRTNHPILLNILFEVCNTYKLTPVEICGRQRGVNLTRARREFCERAKDTGLFSLPEIGYIIGRDHTTVMYHCGLYLHKTFKQRENKRAEWGYGL